MCQCLCTSVIGMAAAGRTRTNRRVVYETLRRKVLTLELPPGAALSENELAAALGVSRTPVRESLILLADEGLVQVFPQVGTFVSRVDPDRVRDAQFLREAVELAALDDVPAEPRPGRRGRSCGRTWTSSAPRGSASRSSSTWTRRSTTACSGSAGTSGRGRPSSPRRDTSTAPDGSG